ncbi:MAG: BamA/TamA family outer membrane protein [Planctomycetes bacterium]|nr:BamA/TamA family outer membrane protein [Planctomycetota bacterium]
MHDGVGALLAVTACALLGACGLFGSSVYVAADTAPGVAAVPVEVAFEGADSIAEFRLRRAIEDRLYDQSRQPDSEAVAQDAVFDLESRYRREGFADVAVAVRREDLQDPDGGRRLRLTFAITEGPRWTVAELRLPGAELLDTDIRRGDLVSLWLQRTADTLGLGDALFVQNDLDGFADSLQLFLRSRGYLDAQVAAPQVERDAAQAAATVTVPIDAGPRYRVRNAMPGPAAAAALPEAERPRAPVGEVADIRKIEAYRYAVLAALRRRGHVDATIRAELTRDVGGAPLLDVVVEAVPGSAGRIDDVRIEGLERTDEDVVRDRLAFSTGELYDGDRVDESLRELYVTGLFERVEIRHAWLAPDEPGTPRPLQLVVDVDEEQSRSVEFLAGYGSYERTRGKVLFEETNLFGTGRSFTAEARVSTRGERGLVTVTDPRLLGTATSLGVSADAYRREMPSFEDRAWGGSIALSRELRERLTARVGYTARLHTDTGTTVQTPAASIDRYTEGDLFVEGRYDSRDAIVYPRSGWQANLKIDANDPRLGATVQFVRARFGMSAYVPLGDRATLALRAESALIWPGEGSERVPLQERLYNGGENSVRSFRESQLGPLDPNGQPLGGEYRNLFGVELRTRATRSLEAALFVDAGNLGSDVRDVTLGDLRPALGAGLRWTLPIGPVRVDAAWNPDRQPGEREWTVHVSVGYPF